MNQKIFIGLLLISPILLKGELNYFHSGYANATTVNRLSDGSIIKMPYRVLSYEPVISYNNFNIIANTALEFRLKDINQIIDSDLKVDLRELYIEWMTPLGDFSFGKQIITWGSASENNPTDNISPYNYYYLFSMGKERKEGIFSFNSTFYYQNFKMNAIFIPNHNANKLPLNDPEFLLNIPIVPTDEQIMELDNSYEYALSLNLALNTIDITASYFSGYDRIVSFFGVNLWTGRNSNPDNIKQDLVLSYRHTNMFGLGLLSTLEAISIKGDFGYFITDDKTIPNGDSTLYRYWESGINEIIQECKEINSASDWDPDFVPIGSCNNDPLFNNSEVINNNAKYYQYIIELEYSPTYDINFISQLSGYHLIDIGDADSIRTSRGTIILDPNEYFVLGLGSPNTFITNHAISTSIRKRFPNTGLELNYTSMFDLNKKGSLHGVGLEYKIFTNINLLIEVTKIFNNEKIQSNPFTAMKDFSRILFEIRYYY